MFRKLLFVALFVGIKSLTSFAQTDYFQQKVQYRIQVRLDPVKHTLHGRLVLDYTNQSPHSLDRLVMHLHPNAYSSHRTAFGQQQIAGGSTRFRYAPDSLRGSMDSLDFWSEGRSLRWEYWHTDTPDIATVFLNQPLLPGATLRLETPFRVRIPGDFSRMGHVGNQYQITQWYPKPAVYDTKGWHPLPYLDQGEFFSEFGSFEVDITVPEHYRVASSGDLQTPSEQIWLDSLARVASGLDSFPPLKARQDSINPAAAPTKTLRYTLEQAHDFAWFCAPDYYVRQSQIQIEDRSVKTYAFFTGRNKPWKDATLYVDSSVYYYSKWLGPYPYNTCTAVEGALRAGGGMEYPTITVISAGGGSPLLLDLIIAHEVGHNWFYGILASNERDHPFMDEGFNSFYETRYLRTRYPGQNELSAQFEKAPKALKRLLEPWPDLNSLSLLLSLRRGKDRSLWHSHTMDYDGETYGTLAYKKTALELLYLEAYLGPEEFDQRMQAYYRTWKFKHPAPDDMERILKTKSSSLEKQQEQVSVASKAVDWWFEERLRKAIPLDYRLVRQRVRPTASGWELEAKLRGLGTATPFTVGITDTAGSLVRQEWLEGFQGSKSFRWDLTVEPQRLLLDPTQSLPLYWRSSANNKNKFWKPSLPLDFEGSHFSWIPWINYLETEGWTPGLLVMSPLILPSNLQYRGLLQWGTRSHAWSGLAKIDYHWFPKQSYGPKWTAGLNWRRFERLGPLNGGTLQGYGIRSAPQDPRRPGHGQQLEWGWRQRYNGNTNSINAGRSAWAGDSVFIPTGVWPYLRGSYQYGTVLNSQAWGWMLQTGRANGSPSVSAMPARVDLYANTSRLLGQGAHRWRLNTRVWAAYAHAALPYRDEQGQVGRIFNGPGLYSPGGLGGAQEYNAQDLLWARPQMVKIDAMTSRESVEQWITDAAWRGLGGRQVILRDAGFRTPAGAYSQFLLQHMTQPLQYQFALNVELDLPRTLVKLPLSVFANVQRNNWNGRSPVSPLATIADLIPDGNPWLAPLPALSWETGITLKAFPFMQFHWLAAVSPDLQKNFVQGMLGAKVPWYTRWSWTLDLSALDPQKLIF